MAKKEKEKERTEPTAPVEASADSPDSAAPIEETFEQRREREMREAFIERNKAAIAARADVLKRNNLPDDTAGIDPAEAATRCCL